MNKTLSQFKDGTTFLKGMLNSLPHRKIELTNWSLCSKLNLTHAHLLDDSWFVWTHGEQKLLQLLDFMNGIHNTIKFTLEYSDT